MEKMMELFVIFSGFGVLLLLSPVCEGATTAAPRLTCNTTTCGTSQYCQDVPGQSAICRACDAACIGCTGAGNTRCKLCQLGYRNISNICEICPPNTYGLNCSGTCRCLHGDSDCNKQTGICTSLQCALGWKETPKCQTPCSNFTFGSGCVYDCHCPPGDACSPINGLCESNTCAVGWTGSGCQTELAQLGNPPTAENVTCANATVVWSGWQKGIDRGDQNVPIAQYELYRSYNLSRGAPPNWTPNWTIIRHVANTATYSAFLDSLVPDAYYIFRVDVRQSSDDKLLAEKMIGKTSEEFYIPCTGATTAAPRLTCNTTTCGTSQYCQDVPGQSAICRACSNFTFGSGCVYDCHCPPGDACSPINGLCESNTCAVGWTGSGCQTELAQLGNPPTAENVTCANATVVWSGWQKGIDRGDQNVPIAQYELYRSYNLSRGAPPNWTPNWTIIRHVANTATYSAFLDSLVPDAYYIFRVDVRQSSDDKLLAEKMIGKTSEEFYIPCTGATTAAPRLTCNTTTCGTSQYCQDVPGQSAICRACDAACIGCTGAGNTRCKLCQLGYRNISNICEICPPNTYGLNCSGTCRCLHGDSDCNKQTGICTSLQCALGWKETPKCQTPCSNFTFGSGCVYDCHCPPGDACSPINGLCESNTCAVGWTGSGCQTELAQLGNPPTAENVTCANATVVWSGWQKGIDRGDQNVPIAQYELYRSYNLSRGAPPNWTPNWTIIRHVANTATYSAFLDSLVPDAYYIFRVDVRQSSDDKLLAEKMIGKTSEEFYIPCTGATTAAPRLTCNTTTCGTSQYCQDVPGQSAICRACDAACIGCTGAGNTRCKLCQLGYRNISNICEICPPNTYGLNCSGTCRCLHGDSDCNKQTGICTSLQCALGWKETPKCQTPCSNFTFGSGCVYDCHCPPGDACSPINGLCESNTCAVGWTGSGCQTELAQLGNPPTAENVTCANATVVWSGWQKGIDRGDQNVPIAQYELYRSYNLSRGAPPNWTPNWTIIRHVANTATYSAFLDSLVPDAYYIFRVDVRQSSDDKLLAEKMIGKTSEEFYIPCTETTTAATTTTPKPTTTRQPGPYLLDAGKFVVKTFETAPSVVQVSWAVLAEVANFTINVTLTYRLIKVVGADCPTMDSSTISINVSKTGSYNITGVLPWRQYQINMSAISAEHNLTDLLRKDVNTVELAPTEPVRSLSNVSISKNGALVKWSAPLCSGRNGGLLYYKLDVYKLPIRNATVFTDNTNETYYQLINLLPYSDYGVSAAYVNQKGPGPMVTQMATFRTLEDVPGPPSIVNIIVANISINLTVEDPVNPNGVITEFNVDVSENENFQPSLTRSFLKNNVSQYTSGVVSDLKPSTLYYVRVSASTSAGRGQASPTQQITTLQSVPPAPVDISSNSSLTNVSCVNLQWMHSQSNSGNISYYTVSYRESGSNQPLQYVNTTVTNAWICNLLPGRFYDFFVTASNPTGSGPAVTITLPTEQVDPPSPPLPEVINTTSSTIGVALYPVVMTNTNYNFEYMLSVKDVSTKSKRAVSNSNTTCPGLHEIPGDVFRNFSQTEMPYKIVFIIGDGNRYGNYINKPLTTDHLYDIYYTISSEFQNVCKYTTVKTRSPVKVVAPVILPAAGGSTATANVGLIIGVVILAILIALVIAAVILYWCWRRRNAGQEYKAYYNEKDESFGLKVYDRVDNYDPQKYWNTVYSLRESRYIVAGREYLPQDKHHMNGNVGMLTAGTPILFNDEFTNLPHGRLAAFNFAKQRSNELKNRFSHLLPYDHSRVILDPDVNSESDYINASFIKGYKHQRAYIASQSPFNEETVLDFWRMIYQYEVRIVVMLSNIVEDNIVKCTQYWPDHGRVMYGQFILDLVDIQEYADYTIRNIKVRTSTDNDWQTVFIFDFTSWPEHGVPDDAIPLLEMRRKVNVYHSRHTTPIVVHCGTGVSRTGVYIAIDSLLNQYEMEGMISVYSFVRKMRKDRPAMVRTAKQYVFIYEAIFEAMVAGDTLTGPGDLKEMYHYLTRKNPTNKHSYLHGQFHALEDFTRKLFPTMCSNAYVPANVDKNRFIEIVPPDLYRPVLSTPGGVGRTDYINAVYMDGHRKSCHYVITQSPLHTTVIDFWKLIYDHDIHTIVMMEPMTYDDDTCAEYWPEDHMKQYEPFFVETTDVYQQENITIRNLKLTYMNNPREARHIRQFQFNAWSDAEFVPKSKSMLLDVMDLVNDWQTVNNNDSTPILVHCKDGATHSGLFIAVSVLCEKVTDENEVDVFHTVKHLKRRRTQIVDMLDQYRFCYKALWDFINMRMPGGTLTPQMSKTKADRPYSSISLASYSSAAHDYMPY